jgi:hypothetical protein
MIPFPFLLKLDVMKIKAEYIGTEIRMRGRRWFISEGNEAEYQEAGLSFIFEAKKPKIKKDATDTKKSIEHIDCDSDGDADIDSSILAV